MQTVDSLAGENLMNVKAGPHNKVKNRKQLDVLGFSGLRHLNKVLDSTCTGIRQVPCSLQPAVKALLPVISAYELRASPVLSQASL